MWTKILPKLTNSHAIFGLCSIFFLLSSIAFAQTTVSGYVRGTEDKPLQNVTVTLMPENITVQTDKIGYYQFKNVEPGEHQVSLFIPNYDELNLTFETNAMDKVKDLGTENLIYSPSSVNQGIITLTDDELDDDESNNQTGISLLQSSRDVFSRSAAFELGSYWFKTRGLDNKYTNVAFNGILMNKQDNGRVTFGNWGGLNDITRYPTEILQGSEISQYSFGNLSSNTYFETRASSFRKGTRLTYSATNRSYRNRLMLSHFTGMTPSGWAFAFSASRRWAEEGIIDGTYYDAYAYFASIEKKINDHHSLNLSGFGAPGRRSTNSPNTQEVFDLKGKNYNSYWGYDDGERRSQRIKKFHEPLIMLSHYWDMNESTALKTTVGYQFGTNGASRLDWNNANNPDPTYYRNLPSWQNVIGISDENLTLLNERWQNDESFSQINWNSLYQQNLSMPVQDHFGETGRRGVYYLVYDKNDDKTLSVNTHLSKEINPNWNLYANLSFQNLQSHNYREVDDLMGSDFALNVDDFNNNLPLGPSAVAREGDMIEYNYKLHRNMLRANLLNIWNVGEKFNVELSTFIGFSESHRDGLWRNGLYGDASFGDSPKKNFVELGMKGEVTYQINGKNYLRWNGTYFTQAPTLDEIFPNARLNNFFTPDLKTKKINSNELSFIHRSPKVKLRATGYYTTIDDDISITRYYAQGLALSPEVGQATSNSSDAFVAEVLTDVGQEYFGGELGIEYNVTSTLSINAVGSFGQFVYSNNPNLTLSVDDVDQQGFYDFGESYLEDYKIGNGPQMAGSFGIRYSSPKYWWAGASANYLANSYLDVSPILRTDNFVTDPTSGNAYYNSDLGRVITDDDVKTILRQEKFEDQFMLNANIGKSFKLGKYYLSLFASVNNILDNRDYITGGFEQGRAANFNDLYEDRNRETPVFGSKYWYARGRTYFINMNFRF